MAGRVSESMDGVKNYATEIYKNMQAVQYRENLKKFSESAAAQAKTFGDSICSASRSIDDGLQWANLGEKSAFNRSLNVFGTAFAGYFLSQLKWAERTPVQKAVAGILFGGFVIYPVARLAITITNAVCTMIANYSADFRIGRAGVKEITQDALSGLMNAGIFPRVAQDNTSITFYRNGNRRGLYPVDAAKGQEVRGWAEEFLMASYNAQRGQLEDKKISSAEFSKWLESQRKNGLGYGISTVSGKAQIFVSTAETLTETEANKLISGEGFTALTESKLEGFEAVRTTRTTGGIPFVWETSNLTLDDGETFKYFAPTIGQ